MSADEADAFKGWTRPGPRPPAGVGVEPGETLDYLSGRCRIFQYEKGHRYSTDDILVAWQGARCAPLVRRALDLGSGIGSVALTLAWKLPGATFVTVEAQELSLRLARKSVRYNGLGERFRLLQGDLRDASLLADESPFDLVTGSPPYFPPGTALAAESEQAVGARIELLGSVADYARTAARHLAPGGVFAFVFPFAQLSRAEEAIQEAGLVTVNRRDVVFKEGKTPALSLFACWRRSDLPGTFAGFVEPPLAIRTADGATTKEYAAVRLSLGIPPGQPEGETLRAAAAPAVQPVAQAH